MCALPKVGREFRANGERAPLSVIVTGSVISHGPGDNEDHETKLKGKKE